MVAAPKAICNVGEGKELAVTVSLQLPVPAHAPDQPANLEPGAGLAVSVTAEPDGNLFAHVFPQLIPAGELVKAQALVQTPGANGAAPLDWKASWVVIGESSLLGDPYFLDVSKPDAEGDCPVYTAMSGQDRWNATLAASSFAQFLRILSTAMEIAAGFGDAIMDDEDEDSFREALGPKVKTIDAAALRAGHWT